MFEVTADHQSRMLRIVLRGFWSDADMARYNVEVGRTMAELRNTGGCRTILIDMVDFPIQTQAIAEAHAAKLRVVKQTTDIRVALIMPSALSRIQAARVASDTGHRTFASEGEAMAWLAGETAA